MEDDGSADAAFVFNHVISVQHAKIVPVGKKGIIGQFDLEMPRAKDTDTPSVEFISHPLRQEVFLTLSRMVRRMKPLDASTMSWKDFEHPKKTLPSITEVTIECPEDHISFTGSENISVTFDDELKVSGIRFITDARGIKMEFPETPFTRFGNTSSSFMFCPLCSDARSAIFNAIISTYMTKGGKTACLV